MKNYLKFLAVGMMLMTTISASAVTFDPNTRYSVKMLDERLAAFNNKSARVGFTPSSCPNWDYVPGLVGKTTLDAWAYYKDVDELKTKTANWLSSIMYYGTEKVDDPLFTGASDLDALNAAKIYCRLYQGATTDAQRTMAKTGMQTAADGINKYVNTNNCKIASGSAAGGWWHKNSYANQMWCDGQYMGPALLAQLIEYNTVYDGLNLDLHGFTWDDVVGQLNLAWTYLWNSSDQLLWHAFTTDKTTGGASGWYNATGAAEIGSETGIYHSAECWSRACGWYIMALVDILESMDNAGYTGAGRTQLITQLNRLAVGLARRQDVASGCWYQLPKYQSEVSATFTATKGGSNTGDATGDDSQCWNEKAKDQAINRTQANYLESSGSCAFVASILKGIRLGYIERNTEITNVRNGSDVQTIEEVAKRGYQGIITNFISNSYELTASCESAGLGSNRNGTAAYYLVGRDVTINNNTEGKVLGAFLMAAVEYERAYLPLNPTCNCLSVRVE